MFCPRASQILTASSSTQAAVEEAGAGVFSSLVCDALEGGAAGHVLRECDRRTYLSLFGPDVRCFRSAATLRGKSLQNLKSCGVANQLSALATPSEDRKTFPNSRLRFAAVARLPNRLKNRAMDGTSHKEDLHSEPRKSCARQPRLLVPIDEEHLYYAAMKKTACRTNATRLGSIGIS